ncbi:MAG: RnfABCDGE type electron transport complex subunit D [Erysipelotrichaceae bacterium]|nr:RnfABCDGE type electron transport complex subunit D [Erysipelotrichaceae bacterium]
METVIENAPQLRTKISLTQKMFEFFGCLVALWIYAIVFYSLKGTAQYNGLNAFVNGIAGILFADFADVLYHLPVLWKKDIVGNRWKEYGYRILHSYSFVTGLLVALLCTISLPWWQVGISAFVGTFFFKLLFGGFGHNIFNPAIIGRAFAQLVFASGMNAYKSEESFVSTGASLTASNGNGGFKGLIGNNFDFGKMFLGSYYGALGETYLLLLLIICVYLCVREIIDWRVPVFYIGSLYLAFLIAFLTMKDGQYAFADAFKYTAIGGIFFGGILCLTDPVTSPTARSGRIIFALGSAFITILLRLFTSSPEGVAYSILIMNFLTPLIDKIVKGRTRNNLVPTIVIAVLFVAVLAVGLTFGLQHTIQTDGSFVA